MPRKRGEKERERERRSYPDMRQSGRVSRQRTHRARETRLASISPHGETLPSNESAPKIALVDARVSLPVARNALVRYTIRKRSEMNRLSGRRSRGEAASAWNKNPRDLHRSRDDSPRASWRGEPRRTRRKREARTRYAG